MKHANDYFCECGRKADEFVGEKEVPTCDECYENQILLKIEIDIKENRTQKKLDNLMKAIYGTE